MVRLVGEVMTPDEQLAGWLEGNSSCPNDRGECCPDFSCCQSDLLVDKQTRQAFINGDDEVRLSMCGMFLGQAFAKATELKDVKIYIAGDAEGTVQ